MGGMALVCDVPSCPAQMLMRWRDSTPETAHLPRAAGPGIENARRLAAEEGWTVLDDEDRCPDHEGVPR